MSVEGVSVMAQYPAGIREGDQTPIAKHAHEPNWCPIKSNKACQGQIIISNVVLNINQYKVWFEMFSGNKISKTILCFGIKFWEIACSELVLLLYLGPQRNPLRNTCELFWMFYNTRKFLFLFSLFESTCVLWMFHAGGVLTDGNLIWNTCPVFEPASPALCFRPRKKLATVKQMTID